MDLNVALVVRLLDQMSGPGGRVVETLKKMKQGAGEFRRAFGEQIKSGFSAANIEEALKKNERDIRDARGRLTGAFGMALTLGAPVMLAGNFQRDMINFANLADLSIEKRQELSRELDVLSRRDRTGLASSDLLAGLSTYVGKGLSTEDGVAALEATGRAAKATGAQFDEMAAAGFAAMDNMKVTPNQLRKAFDMMAASGKEGSFELKDMARNFPELTASAQSIGMSGLDGVASLSAALQVAMKSAGSADQAANNTSNFLGKLTSPDTVAKFADFGVDVQRELEKAAANGIDPLEHMLSVIERVTGGDQFKMGELFGDKQVLDFLRAVIPNMEEYRRIKAAAASADGVVDKDYEAVMTGFNESVTQLRQSLSGLFGASGVLLPILTEMLQSATSMVDAVRDWTDANPELTAWIVKGAAAMLAMGIGARVLGYVFAVGRGSLIRFLSLFLKFDAAGRNISLIGRLLGGLGKGFSWAKIIPEFAWKSVIGVLSWAGFIPKKLRLQDFGPGVTQIGPAMASAATQTEAAAARMRAAISSVKWKSLSAGLMMFEALSKVPEDPAQIGAFQERNRAAMMGVFEATPGISHLMAGQDKLRQWWAGGATPEEAEANDAARARRSEAERDWMRGHNFGVIPPSQRDYPFSPNFLQPELIRPGGISRPVEIAPPAGAGGSGAAARPEPVRIEETINHDYKAENTVTVNVPVQIVQQAAQNADRVARDVGQQVERATRKALSDTGGPQ